MYVFVRFFFLPVFVCMITWERLNRSSSNSVSDQSWPWWGVCVSKCGFMQGHNHTLSRYISYDAEHFVLSMLHYKYRHMKCSKLNSASDGICLSWYLIIWLSHRIFHETNHCRYTAICSSLHMNRHDRLLMLYDLSSLYEHSCLVYNI